ncbi:ROK family transcriptional regulator [Vibrio sp. WXL210]|uniref:ROK family transcriptional regulator n=1 Tax=Vibrio sp. WXL210 TaxID=3450709 RepID=UPI003EC607AE
MRLLGNNIQTVRQHNLRMVLENIALNRGISRSSLAQALNISIPTISSLVDELIERGLVSFVSDPQAQTGKRNKAHLELVRHDYVILCIHVLPNCITTLLANSCYQIDSSLKRTSVNFQSPSDIVEAISGVYMGTKRELPDTEVKIALAFSGEVDSKSGTSVSMGSMGFTEPVEISYLLKTRFDVQVEVENDCVCMALAEKWLGQTHNPDHSIVLLDHGVGAVTLKASPTQGKMIIASNIGHTTAAMEGRPCQCGSVDCLELYGSLKSVETMVAGDSAFSDLSAATQIIHRLAQSPQYYEHYLHQLARPIGFCLAQHCKLLGSYHVSLYGEICNLGDTWLSMVRSETRRYLPKAYSYSDECVIDHGELSYQQIVSGACFLYLEKSISSL